MVEVVRIIRFMFEHELMIILGVLPVANDQNFRRGLVVDGEYAGFDFCTPYSLKV